MLAVITAKQRELIQGALSKPIYDKFAESKLAKGQDYNIQVSLWKAAQYLTKFQQTL